MYEGTITWEKKEPLSIWFTSEDVHVGVLSFTVNCNAKCGGGEGAQDLESSSSPWDSAPKLVLIGD